MTDRYYKVYRIAGYVHELVCETGSHMEAMCYELQGYAVVEVRSP